MSSSPPEGDPRSFDSLTAVIARLRAPDGCPWDRAQTHSSLRPFMLEEAYEAVGAIDEGKHDKLREELGDVLLQVTLHSQIASETGEFTIHDVIEGITTKLLRRHPHVFGEKKLDTAKQVEVQWEELKATERDESPSRQGLDAVPEALPALAYSQKLQERAASTGFDWPGVDDLLPKLTEEAAELARAQTIEEQREELGDVLWMLVCLARKLDLNAEESLRLAARRFRQRFARLEEIARERSLTLGDVPIDALESLWRETKR